MAKNDPHISYRDENGNERVKNVSSARQVFDFPEAHPEFKKPGATLVSGNNTYYRNSDGQLQNFPNFDDGFD